MFIEKVKEASEEQTILTFKVYLPKIILFYLLFSQFKFIKNILDIIVLQANSTISIFHNENKSQDIIFEIFRIVFMTFPIIFTFKVLFWIFYTIA